MCAYVRVCVCACVLAENTPYLETRVSDWFNQRSLPEPGVLYNNLSLVTSVMSVYTQFAGVR